jgi:hypothetical protein
MLNQLNQNIYPEMELLLCCARPLLDSLNIQKIESILKQEIDWDELVQIAINHKLIPLAYHNLKLIAKDVIPEKQLKTLHHIFYTNAQRSLILTGELVNVVKLLQSQGISSVPYKGPILANLLYGNVGLRQFADLDLIVQRADISQVRKILTSHGYKAKVELNEIQEIAYLNSKSEHTYDFIELNKGILLEVHWRITPQYKSPIEPQHFWDKLKPFHFAGLDILTLPLEDWLLILCVHASRHRWEQLSWICEIAQLIRISPEIDWERITNEANNFDCKRMLFLGLFLTHYLIEPVLPVTMLEQIKEDSEVVKIATQIREELLIKNNTSQKFLTNTLYHIQIREKWQNKILYFESFVRWATSSKK